VLPGRKRHRTLNQDKGQRAAVTHVIDAVRRGEPSPFSVELLLAVSRATLRADQSVRTGRAIGLTGPPGSSGAA
jgi:hypothetical protein